MSSVFGDVISAVYNVTQGYTQTHIINYARNYISCV